MSEECIYSGTHLGGYQNDSQQFKQRYCASCGVPRTVKKGQKQFQHHVGGIDIGDDRLVLCPS
jgi:hypothetical protein